MKCPKCGVDVRNGLSYCMNCGASLPVESPTPRTLKSTNRIVAPTIAVIGILLLVIGLATCFMSVEEATNYYGMPIYHTTYPYREDGASLAVVGAIMGIVGIVGFFVSKYRNS